MHKATFSFVTVFTLIAIALVATGCGRAVGTECLEGEYAIMHVESVMETGDPDFPYGFKMINTSEFRLQLRALHLTFLSMDFPYPDMVFPENENGDMLCDPFSDSVEAPTCDDGNIIIEPGDEYILKFDVIGDFTQLRLIFVFMDVLDEDGTILGEVEFLSDIGTEQINFWP